MEASRITASEERKGIAITNMPTGGEKGKGVTASQSAAEVADVADKGASGPPRNERAAPKQIPTEADEVTGTKEFGPPQQRGYNQSIRSGGS